MSLIDLYWDLKKLHEYKQSNGTGINFFFFDTIKNILFVPSVWFLVVFRVGQIIQKVPVLNWFYLLFIWRPITLITGIEIYPSTKVGKGLVLPHFGQIFVNPNSVIGDNVLIFNSVTIGTNFNYNGSPKIGDNVKIGVGAKIIGPVIIESGATINANKVIGK